MYLLNLFNCFIYKLNISQFSIYRRHYHQKGNIRWVKIGLMKFKTSIYAKKRIAIHRKLGESELKIKKLQFQGIVCFLPISELN